MKTIKLIALLVMAFLLIACGPSDANDSAEKSGDLLEGSVIVDGSGTVYPLMASIAEAYMVDKQTSVSVQVGRAGSSAGFKKFIKGETDFSNASRQIKASETEQFAANGFSADQLLEIKIALDGLTMVINKENDWASNMTEQEVINMYVSGSYRTDDKVKWSDIRSEWPSEEIHFYGPNENHGTYEFFYESILEEQPLVKTANLQQEYATLVDLVSKDKNAIAFFGYGYYASNKDKIKAVAIDFGVGNIEPTLDTIGEKLAYKNFTRPVFTYINLVHAKKRPQVLDFAKFVVSEEGATRWAAENGFAPLPTKSYQLYLDQLNALE